MLPPIEREWQAALERLDQEHMGRQLVAQPEGADFLTNDVLGLSQHPAVRQAAAQAASLYGVGARASRLLGGDHGLLLQAEAAAAAWIGTPAALLFPTGFQANLGLLGALAGPADVLLSDELNHASLIDGAKLSGARVVVYDHATLDRLRDALKANLSAHRRWVVTESLFSMDGDMAPLAAIVELCRTYDARLIVDEAHAAGLVGPQGRGACATLADADDVLIARVVTGGKALGVAGAFVLGSEVLRRWLLHRARAFVYTTGIPLPLAAALTAAIELVPSLDAERARVLQGARRLALALELPEPAGAVVPIPCGPAQVALELARTLRQQGLSLHAVRPPTVPEGSSRLRVVLHHDWSEPSLERLIEAVRTARMVGTQTKASGPRPKPWVVVGTDTDVGKTITSAILVHLAAREGPVFYWKPIQSGLPSDTETLRALCTDCQLTCLPPGIEFSLPKSPDQAAAAEGRTIQEARIQRQLEQHLSTTPGPWIVETAGGLLVPWNDHFQNLDWLAQIRPKIALVARSGLGTLNHTQLSLRALAQARLAPDVVFLVGPPHRDNREFLARQVACPVLEIPWLESLDAAHLAEFASTLDRSWFDAARIPTTP
ncbi:MAG: dethiobiotin synthase [Planctomycetes bacterium]|nr:dethiobiotin synthase [Planctomycetota bacterium]MCB9909893.1 dethiobiotin synthase [Planctomycetota bacterium]HPF14319.1 dethiobiotin synthase [Planctomycetota bacterium]